MWRKVMLTVTAAVLVGCGDGAPSESTSTGASPDSSASAVPLDVYAVEATITGGLAEVLEVAPWPPGILTPTAPLSALVTLTASEPVPIADLPFFADAFPADHGDGSLGVSGICSRGWHGDGTRITDEPCAAAEPVAHVEPGFPLTLPLVLHPRTDVGVVEPGRYVLEVPLADEAALRIALDVAPRDPARLPPLEPRAGTLAITLEEAPSALASTGVEVVVEDVYRRPLDRRSLSEAASGAPAYEVAVPVGPVRVVLVAPDGDDDGRRRRCGEQHALVDGTAPRPLAVLFESVGLDGQCPAGELVFDRQPS